jgi:hypothetical protein
MMMMTMMRRRRAKQTALREGEVLSNPNENGSVMRLETESIGLNLKVQKSLLCNDF